MELRSMQTALLAGRSASRWALSTSTSAPKPYLPISLYATTASRSFSRSFAARQEGEAPAGGMNEYFARKLLQEQQPAQPTQPTQSTEPTQTPSNASSLQPSPSAPNNSIFAVSGTSPDLMTPWQTPKKTNMMIMPNSGGDFLKEMGVEGRYHAPTSADLAISDARGESENPINRKLRLRPVIGRTVDFETARDPKQRDLALGLARLNMMCRVNKVSKDALRQRFHERPGLRKKRQKSERWQKRFREGFQATCARVSELAKQGW